MLNKTIRTTIIAITKYILPVVLLLLLGPLLVQFSQQLTQANQFFHLHQGVFLFMHSLLYLALYWLWPRIIHRLVNRSPHEITQEQINFALNAKWYLLTALVFFELLFWWR
ncbi:hypothetical protein A6J40_00490 [Legionella longbeachae]|uniref:hypothetical protein n=1 Tax=Legionella longbeachae TaxID=450 RepID=UPI0009B7DE0F|nr:hypothetical protein [Legionella longbeachae]VEE03005.1 Uncharacterised protein [Legionella oakridgensis]HAT8966740.1 hypothetical protein [Legionella pneumophila subsp. pneumophila]HAU1059721.1 hypothetical protein [Legionella pneumophila]ARB90766.1 hypothetical protein A6J40_00490 [Legionella longbeachae]RZV22661.1 hypothetical protein EKG34_14705 [Legionella longbeachae]